MEAARVAALRGHDVTLFDNRDKLGGALIDASIPYFKKDLAKLRSYLVNQMKKLQVRVRKGTKASVEDIVKGKPDVVIVATGSTHILPKIPGIDKTIVADALEVLRGLRNVGEKVVVMGADMIGCEIAWLLKKKKKSVTLATRNREEVGYNVPFVPKMSLMEVFAELNLTICADVVLKAITDTGVRVIGNGEELAIEADDVIVVGDFVPNGYLIEALYKKGLNVLAVGDCVECRSIHHAIYEGHVAGYI
jgi:2-enoate reductase